MPSLLLAGFETTRDGRMIARSNCGIGIVLVEENSLNGKIAGTAKRPRPAQVRQPERSSRTQLQRRQIPDAAGGAPL